MFWLDLPDTEQMFKYADETIARHAYAQTYQTCALYNEDICIAEKVRVDTGIDPDGNAIYILEEQECEGDEFVCLSVEDDDTI